MKKLIFIIMAGLFLSTFAFSQTTWNGTALTGNTYRSGNVGIGPGMTNPQVALHINGEIQGNQQNGALRIKTTQGTLDIGPQGSNWCHIYTSVGRFLFNKEIVSSTGSFGSYNTSNLYLYTGATGSSEGNLRMTILNSNGNVGIGTSSPYEPLHLYNPTINGATGIRLNVVGQYYTTNYYNHWNIVAGATGGSSQIEFKYGQVQGSNSNPSMSRLLIIGANGYVSASGQLSAPIFRDLDDGSYYMDPSSTSLSIKVAGLIQTCGKIEAEEIEVKNVCATNVKVKMDNLADFVFDEDYNRMSLYDLDQYINQNKHLPNIPSATEVKENGMDVAQMSNLMLQKIEELTLYTIEQQKLLEEQAKQIKELQEVLINKN